MSKISNEEINNFKKQRKTSFAAPLCYAPSMSMNFDQSGEVTACCFNRDFVLGHYPEQSLSQIWDGEKIKELRKALEEDDLSLGCQQCDRYIQAGNFDSVLIRHFDDHASLSPAWKEKTNWWSKLFASPNENSVALYPVMFEFELSNQCNLECIMCGGKWSSAIRKNREHLPAIKSPYDSNFVNEIKQFLPNLKRANFLGGEPFLIHLYQEIWQSIIDINPEIEVAITSNGTVLNARAKKIIEQLPRCIIALSIDSLKKETWEEIRKNGHFETLMENINWLLERKKVKSFSVCPIIQNRYEIPELIEFCVENELDIFFNVVNGPLGGKIEGIHYSINDDEENILPEVSIQELDIHQLEDLEKYYLGFKFKDKYQFALDNLIQQVQFWRNQKSNYAQ